MRLYHLLPQSARRHEPLCVRAAGQDAGAGRPLRQYVAAASVGRKRAPELPAAQAGHRQTRACSRGARVVRRHGEDHQGEGRSVTRGSIYFSRSVIACTSARSTPPASRLVTGATASKKPFCPLFRTLITPTPGVLPVLTCGSAVSGLGPRNDMKT